MAMVVGVAKLSLRLHGNQSLKGKRKVIKSICERLRQRFNLAVAETDAQDLWQAGEVGLVARSEEHTSELQSLTNHELKNNL